MQSVTCFKGAYSKRQSTHQWTFEYNNSNDLQVRMIKSCLLIHYDVQLHACKVYLQHAGLPK